MELNKNIKSFCKEFKNCFLGYDWPGNVRELKNVIRRVALLKNENQIEASVLPLELNASNYSNNQRREKKLPQLKVKSDTKQEHLRNTTQEAEYLAILSVLKNVNFNKAKAAKILNIDRKTLYNKIKTLTSDDEV